MKKSKFGFHVLLLGYSGIARRRIIPALKASGVDRLDIASQLSAEQARAEALLPGNIFDSYQDALNKSTADIVYISLVNSAHFPWAEKALAKKFHVVIDKPAFTSLGDAERLASFANQNMLLLAEANVFPFHPQISMIHELFSRAEEEPTRVSAIFSFPPLAKNDFRYKAELGGNAMYDLGPYAIAAGSEVFGDYPKKVFCQINSRGGVDNVVTAFSIAAYYSGGRTMVGHFGFDTGYQNTINILGPSMNVRFDRVFTIPPDYANTLYICHKNGEYQLSVPPSDSFKNYFDHVLKAISVRQFDSLNNKLLMNSKSLDMLISSAVGEI